MKKIISIILTFSLIALPCFAAQSKEAAPAELQNEQIKQLEKSNSELSQQVNDLKSLYGLSTTKTAVSDAELKLSEYNANVALLQIKDSTSVIAETVEAAFILSVAGSVLVLILTSKK